MDTGIRRHKNTIVFGKRHGGGGAGDNLLHIEPTANTKRTGFNGAAGLKFTSEIDNVVRAVEGLDIQLLIPLVSQYLTAYKKARNRLSLLRSFLVC